MEKKSKQCTKPDYSTIDEAKLQRIAKNKLEAINSETNKEEPEYMEIFESAYSTIAGKVAAQDNPYYSIPSEHPIKTKDNLVMLFHLNIKLRYKHMPFHLIQSILI